MFPSMLKHKCLGRRLELPLPAMTTHCIRDVLVSESLLWLGSCLPVSVSVSFCILSGVDIAVWNGNWL